MTDDGIYMNEGYDTLLNAEERRLMTWLCKSYDEWCRALRDIDWERRPVEEKEHRAAWLTMAAHMVEQRRKADIVGNMPEDFSGMLDRRVALWDALKIVDLAIEDYLGDYRQLAAPTPSPER